MPSRISFLVLCLTLLLPIAGNPLLAQASDEKEIDVYLLSGQSNMQGIGKLENAPEHWRERLESIMFWNGKAFEPLAPQTTKLSTRKGEFGPEIGFARGLVRAGRTQAVALIKFHRSGQPLHHGWDGNKWIGGEPQPKRRNFYPGAHPDDPNRGRHYADWLSQVNQALKALKDAGYTPQVRGVAWMQGEQDSKHEVSAKSYAKHLKQLRNRLAEDLGQPAPPWVYGQVLPHSPALPRFSHRIEIRKQMADLDERSDTDVATSGMRMVSTDGFGLLPDTVHYNAAGQRKLGLAMASAMVELERAKPFALKASLVDSGVELSQSDPFHGFDQIEFQLGGVACKMVQPRHVAAERPWILRSRFWGHQPQFDIAMLERGWHVCYCDVAGLFGNQKAVRRWNEFYGLAQNVGLSPQPVVEAMSRGGLIAIHWAEANPDRVGGIYFDNAVMDIRSWPGGQGAGKGHPATWKQCLKAFGQEAADQATIDKIAEQTIGRADALRKSKIPVFVILNGADDVVPPDENGERLVQLLQVNDGSIEVVRRPKLGHHPHSLKDPQPIVDFALKAMRSAR